ncbi:S53 family peptidase [Geomonas sp. Red32]|uniref:protease pro-enzyme activation domain-containing protein n=1 Tax=Geomonas sp. Red32 TaxID=2912856 RepID=UPI00202CBBBA|nr:S53 family peptidase [Geomonas sp. Red32]
MVAVICLVSLLTGATQALAGRFVDDNDTVVLTGNTHPLARSPQGRAKASLAAVNLPMEHMILSLQVPAAKQAALQKLLKEQKDPSSPNYHHWLTPEQFGAQFGPSAEDLKAVTEWLASHGFTVEETGKSRTWINFSGTVNQVEVAFKTRMTTFTDGNREFHANATDPSIPRGLADLVSGVVTLHNIPRQPKNSGLKTFASPQAVPNYTSGSNHYVAPGDFATIYNVKPLYTGGVDGTGQSIAIVGRTHPSTSNWTTFRSKMGLPANTPQIIVNGADPGDLGASEGTEADLDVEWAGAVAKNAAIKYVTSKSTNSTDGVDLSAQYIVANNLAPVMSMSFGSCESDMGNTENAFYNNLWAQAASQGITVLVASGDSGAAGCSSASGTSGSGQAVNGLASTPYNIAVGGTQFNDAAGSYWNSVSSTDMTSATGYIPEAAWNESGTVSGGSGLWATGGGVSRVYAKPSWQAAPGVPQDGKRDVPDVALTAAAHDGYLIYSNGSLGAVGGTSASSPSFAGLMALVVQKSGRQGNANPQLYVLGNNQYAAGGAKVFHDVTSSNNSVPGVSGYASGTGYDLATGLGSVDAAALVGNWGATTVKAQPDFALSTMASQSVTAGKSVAVPFQVSVSGGFSSAVSFSVSGLSSGVTAAVSPASLAAPGSGSATVTVTAASSAAAGARTVTVTATGGGVTHTQSFTVTVVAPDFSLTAASPAAIAQGGSGSLKVTTTAGTGFASAVTLTVSGLPSGVTASFSPVTIASPGTGSSTLTLTASATAATGTRSITVTATAGSLVHSVTVPVTIQSATIFSSSFTDSWYAVGVSGSYGRWYIVTGGSSPSAAPHSGTAMAMFNSYSAPSGNQVRMFNDVVYTIPATAKGATLSFWMYHDTGRSTYGDKVQAQVTTNGSTWTNIGAAVSRYASTAGWSQVNVDLTPYVGKNFMFGFLGISAGGYNMYLDDVAITLK